jgi:hypothetical protein
LLVATQLDQELVPLLPRCVRQQVDAASKQRRCFDE